MLFEKEPIPNIVPFAHAANALELPDGSIFVVWYCGAYEGAEDQRLAGALRVGNTWQAAHVVVDHFEFDGETWTPETAVPILTPSGEVWLYFFAFPHSRFRLVQDVRSYYIKPHHAGFDCIPRRMEQPLWCRDLMKTRVFRTRLADFKQTVVEPVSIPENAPILQGRALHLQDGGWVFPFHCRRGTEMRSARVSAGFLIGDANLENWQMGAEIFAEPGCSEPAIVQLHSGQVLCYMRRPGLTRTPPPPWGHIWRAISTDGCRTFSAPTQTNLRNPDTGNDLYLGRGDRLVVAFNDSYTERCPMTVGISDDLGMTFRSRDVESGLGAYAYPKLLQTRDGVWHLFYSFNYSHIAHAWFDAEWLENGRQLLG